MATTQLADHHVALADGWAVWKWFVLRSAGFTAANVDALGNAAFARDIDAWLERTRNLELRVDQLIATCEAGHKRALVRLAKALHAFEIPESTSYPVLDASVASELVDLARTRSELTARYRTERIRISATLCTMLADPRLVEAITWQNRQVLQTGILKLLETAVDADNTTRRKREYSLANYIQRYCTKNDTISFFGPVGRGTFVRSGEPVARPGESLLQTRAVYFEHWAIDELATRLSNETDLLIHIAPRRMPTIRVDGSVLHHSLGQQTELPAPFVSLIEACDGTRTALEIATALIADPSFETDDVDEVYAMLGELCDQHVLCWRLDIPRSTAYPCQVLRELVERAGEPARSTALATIGRLEAACARVAEAAANPAALDLALQQVDETFSDITGRSAIRKAGEMYAGRTLVYEDCVRDYELQLGPQALAPISRALPLLLTSARWYSHALADRYRARLEACYDELSAETGERVVDYLKFFDRIGDLFPTQEGGNAKSDVVLQVVSELQARWAAVLDVSAAERSQQRIERSSDSLASRVAASFAAPGPGWPTARFHSPDLMIAAPTAADAIAGRGLYVLGEVHTGWNTVTMAPILKGWPLAAEVLRAERDDIGTCRVGPVIPKASCTRLDAGPQPDVDYEVAAVSTRSALPPDRVLAAAELVVERTERGLEVCSRDRKLRFDAIAFLETSLVAASFSGWNVLGAGAHTPRLTIDNLVVARERWRFSPDELPFASAERGLVQFSAARQWAQQHRLPRLVFVKATEETKPIYMDLASPLYVEMLAKLVRHSSALTFSEMLPSVEDLWLSDAAGNRFTSELRICSVDPVRWQAPHRTL